MTSISHHPERADIPVIGAVFDEVSAGDELTASGQYEGCGVSGVVSEI